MIMVRPSSLSAGKLERTVIKSLAQADSSGDLLDPPVVLAGNITATAIQQRNLDILKNGVLRDQIIGLEDEADHPVSRIGEGIVVHLTHILTAQDILSPGWAIERSE